MKQAANLLLSSQALCVLEQHEQRSREQKDLAPASLHNDLSEVRHSPAWCETRSAGSAVESEHRGDFDLQAETIPTLTRYSTSLQASQRQKPALVNRTLIGLKRFFASALPTHPMTSDPAAVVKPVREVVRPWHLNDDEEQALAIEVKRSRNLRKCTHNILLLHTGLSPRELCQLRGNQVKLGKRRGFLPITRKRNPYHKAPNRMCSRRLR